MGWGIACGILFFLCWIPLGIQMQYNCHGFFLKVVAGFLRITVFPGKRKKNKAKKERKPADAASSEKTAEPEQQPAKPPKKSDSAKTDNQTGGNLRRFLPWIRLGFDFLGDFRRKLRMDHLYLRLVLAGDDPCDLAVNYGRAWAAVGNLLPTLERLFVIKERDIEVACDFEAEETRVVFSGDVTITLGRLLWLAVWYGVRACKEFIVMKRKGGAVK